MKKFTVKKEVMDHFKAVQRTDKKWVIDLAGNGFLHWIEVANDRPVTCSNPDITMQSWNFKEEAEAIIEWLKRRWSQDPNITADQMESLKVTVNLDDYETKEISDDEES